MAKVVTIMNMKGGVGKTTLCMHLGGVIARYRSARVLLIDYDPQFNLSQALLRSRRYFQLEASGRTSLRILQDADSDLDPYQIQTPISANPPGLSELVESIYRRKDGARIDLVPSTLDLMYIALGTSGGNLPLLETRFRKFIAAARQEYDLVLIDCHPAGSVLTRTSLQNSDHVLIPVAPQAYAVRGVALMLRFIESSRPDGAGPHPHIVFNLIPRTGPPTAAESQIRAHAVYGPLCLAESLKKYKAYSEPQEGFGFVWSSKKPYSTQALGGLLRLAMEFVDRIGLSEELS